MRKAESSSGVFTIEDLIAPRAMATKGDHGRAISDDRLRNSPPQSNGLRDNRQRPSARRRSSSRRSDSLCFYCQHHNITFPLEMPFPTIIADRCLHRASGQNRPVLARPEISLVRKWASACRPKPRQHQ